MFDEESNIGGELARLEDDSNTKMKNDLIRHNDVGTHNFKNIVEALQETIPKSKFVKLQKSGGSFSNASSFRFHKAGEESFSFPQL